MDPARSRPRASPGLKTLTTQGDPKAPLQNLPELDVDVELLRAGDPAEMKKLVEVYGPVFKSIFSKIAVDRHHLADIAQDFWMHLVPRLDRYHERTPFNWWLVRAAKNFRASRVRKDSKAAARTAEFEEQRELVSDGSGLDDKVQKRILEDVVAKALSGLPGREGEALTLTLLEGWTNVEAAKIMDIRSATVGALVRRALFRLQDDDLLKAFHDDL